MKNAERQVIKTLPLVVAALCGPLLGFQHATHAAEKQEVATARRPQAEVQKVWERVLQTPGKGQLGAAVSARVAGHVLAGTSGAKEGEVPAWVKKIRPGGKTEWSTQVGRPGCVPTGIARGYESGYMMTGKDGRDEGVWVALLDMTGGMEWERSSGGPGGGWGWKRAFGVTQPEARRYMIGAMFGKPHSVAFMNWTGDGRCTGVRHRLRSPRDAGSDSDGRIISPHGGCLVMAEISLPKGSPYTPYPCIKRMKTPHWITRMNKYGLKKWTRQLDRDINAAIGIKDGYVVAGSTVRQEVRLPWVGELDLDGRLRWANTVGDTAGTVTSLAELDKAGCLIAGREAQDSKKGQPHTWLAMYKNGELKWREPVDVPCPLDNVTLTRGQQGYLLAGEVTGGKAYANDLWMGQFKIRRRILQCESSDGMFRMDYPADWGLSKENDGRERTIVLTSGEPYGLLSRIEVHARPADTAKVLPRGKSRLHPWHSPERPLGPENSTLRKYRNVHGTLFLVTLQNRGDDAMGGLRSNDSDYVAVTENSRYKIEVRMLWRSPWAIVGATTQARLTEAEEADHRENLANHFAQLRDTLLSFKAQGASCPQVSPQCKGLALSRTVVTRFHGVTPQLVASKRPDLDGDGKNEIVCLFLHKGTHAVREEGSVYKGEFTLCTGDGRTVVLQSANALFSGQTQKESPPVLRVRADRDPLRIKRKQKKPSISVEFRVRQDGEGAQIVDLSPDELGIPGRRRP